MAKKHIIHDTWHVYGSVIGDQESEFTDLNGNYNCKISLSPLDQKLPI